MLREEKHTNPLLEIAQVKVCSISYTCKSLTASAKSPAINFSLAELYTNSGIRHS